ncbi:hypothetical protein [Microlunatus speluncae]|uniref:hypothetical protein n=1 Tax=Microlunatus speluncae TaxID=2594267 RepID=UPI001266083F|nr:hypothetical protein [Microlunatus speluncae]
MGRSPSFALRPARPYLITALALGTVGAGGMLLADALQLNYLSTLLALGGAGLLLLGLIFLLAAAVVVIVALVRGRGH